MLSALSFVRILPFALLHYGALGALALLAYVVGRALTRRLDYHSAWEKFAFCTGLGLGALSFLMFALGLVRILYLPVVLAALAGICALCTPVWREMFRGVVRLRPPGAWKSWVAGVAVAAVVLPFLVLPLYPPTAFDSTMYHLPFAIDYVENHRIAPVVHLRFPVFPQANEMLFALALLLFDDVTAQLIQVLMMLVIAAALFGWGIRSYSPRTGIWAAALWLASPMVIKLGASAYVDIGAGLFVTLGVYALFNFLSTRKIHWMALSGLFIGCAVASKYTALIFFPVLGTVVLFVALRHRKWGYLVTFALAAVITGAPWYLYNTYHTGNPVFPFSSQIFGYSYWSPEDLTIVAGDLQAYGAGKTLISLLMLPWNLSLNQWETAYRLSPVHFLAFPLLLIVGASHSRMRGLVAVIAAYMLYWFSATQVLRYLALVLPILSLATAAMFDQIPQWVPILRKPVGGFLSVLAVALLLVSPGWSFALSEIQREGPPPVNGRQREAYLTRALPLYPAYKFLNQTRENRYTLYALYGENMNYYAGGKVMGDWYGPGRYSQVAHLSDNRSRLVDGGTLYDRLRRLGADYLLVATDRAQVALPQDTFFLGHFRLIFAKPGVLLFRLEQQPLQQLVMGELFRNPGFEHLDGPWPGGWSHTGHPVVDDSGQQSHTGRVALRCEGPSNVFYQSVAVRPGAFYRLSLFARSAGAQHGAWLQFSWSDAHGKFLSSDVDSIRVVGGWNHHEMILMAPDGAVSATFYAISHTDSSVWFDDVSLAELSYEPAPAQPKQASSAPAAGSSSGSAGTDAAR